MRNGLMVSSLSGITSLICVVRYVIPLSAGADSDAMMSQEESLPGPDEIATLRSQ